MVPACNKCICPFIKHNGAALNCLLPSFLKLAENMMFNEIIAVARMTILLGHLCTCYPVSRVCKPSSAD